jgi:hypothetical protein
MVETFEVEMLTCEVESPFEPLTCAVEAEMDEFERA